jgi:hypothetical protein
MPDCHPLSDSHLVTVKAIDDMAWSQLRAAALTKEQLAEFRAHTFTTGCVSLSRTRTWNDPWTFCSRLRSLMTFPGSPSLIHRPP